MGFWSRFREFFFGEGGDDDDDTPRPQSETYDYDVSDDVSGYRDDNGLPEGWHFHGIVENGKHRFVTDDDVTDDVLRNADRVFVVKDFDGKLGYRQYSSAWDAEQIGDFIEADHTEGGSPL